MRCSTSVLAALAVLVLIGAPAAAQDARPQRGDRLAPPRLSPEQVRTAWQWQARGVAHGLELSAELTDQLIEAYLTSRDDLRSATEEAVEKMRADWPDDAEGGPPRIGWSQLRELTAGERLSLEERVKVFLDPEKTKEAIAALGAFNRGWDGMVHAVVGFELPEEKTYAALEPIQAYVVKTSLLQRGRDRQAMRRVMGEAREKLREQLGSILTEEQMKQFQRATRRSGGQRGGMSPQRLMEYDENGDGKLQRDELPERMGRFFDRFDANGDDVIDAKELEAIGRGPRRQQQGI
jgi:hypothetical protein